MITNELTDSEKMKSDVEKNIDSIVSTIPIDNFRKVLNSYKAKINLYT